MKKYRTHSTNRLISGACLLLIGIVVSLTFLGCSHTASPTERDGYATIWDLDSYPLNVFMGVSAPYSTREKEVAEALYNCARSIAIHEGIQVTSRLVSESSSSGGLLSFATDGQALYAEDQVREILDRLELIEVRSAKAGGVVILARDPARPAARRPYMQRFDAQRRPDWVKTTPDIPGYLVAVGETLGYRFVRDSLEAADVLAAEALIDASAEAVTESRSYAVNVQGERPSGTASFFQEGVFQVASGNLEGFVILARWHDAHTNRYYSLAAVPLSQK